MSRRFRVGVRVINVHVYEVELDGTADPEQAPPDWLAITQDMDPVSVEYGPVTVSFADELARPRGQ